MSPDDRSSRVRDHVRRPAAVRVATDANAYTQGCMRTRAERAIIHVVDDDPEFRSAIARLLAASGYGVALFENATKLLEERPRPERGCILLDLKMPDMSGLQLQRLLVERAVPLPIVFMTGCGDIPTSVLAIKAGAEDFLSKPVSRRLLVETIERALRRFDEERDRLRDQAVARSLIKRLTPRERQVFDLVVVGQMNKQIAYQLGTSERTIKAHRHSVMQKLEVRSIAALVSLADRVGIARGGGVGMRDDRARSLSASIV